MAEEFPSLISVSAEDAGQRLDQFLAAQLDVSRARVQELISQQKILVDDAAAKASLKLRGGERIRLLGPAARPPLRAVAENIPLKVVYEDDDLAVIDKPAGMMVHAGAGSTDDARNRGTLVNALLHHLENLSAMGGELRPGIVHRLDKETSGLIVVAKNDEAHRRLAAQFAHREVKKTYIALVHGWMKKDRGTIAASISRDRVRRTRMTTRASGGREAVSHYDVIRRLDTAFGRFTLVEMKIDTGRTHQIRVHMASLGHPVVGDALYGAPRELRNHPFRPKAGGSEAPADIKTTTVSAKKAVPARKDEETPIALGRNFLHAARLELQHPHTGQKVLLESPLPDELEAFLKKLEKSDARELPAKQG